MEGMPHANESFSTQIPPQELSSPELIPVGEAIELEVESVEPAAEIEEGGPTLH